MIKVVVLFCRFLQANACHCVLLGLGLLPASPSNCLHSKSKENTKKAPAKKDLFFFYPVVDLIALNCSIFMRNHDVLFGKTNPCLRCIERCWVDDFQAVLCFAKRFCMLVTVK